MCWSPQATPAYGKWVGTVLAVLAASAKQTNGAPVIRGACGWAFAREGGNGAGSEGERGMGWEWEGDGNVVQSACPPPPASLAVQLRHPALPAAICGAAPRHTCSLTIGSVAWTRACGFESGGGAGEAASYCAGWERGVGQASAEALDPGGGEPIPKPRSLESHLLPSYARAHGAA